MIRALLARLLPTPPAPPAQPTPAGPRYVCVSHFPVEITYTCGGQNVPVIGGEFPGQTITIPTHDHTCTQYHHTDRFSRDDVADQDVLRAYKSSQVGGEVRRYYEEQQARLVHNADHIIVVSNGPDRNGFLAGFARSHDEAMRFVATGDRSRLFTPWESTS